MTPQSSGWILALLILLGAVAALVVAGMIYGRRLAHQRHRAEEAAEERAEEAGVELPPEDDAVAVETDAEPVAKEPDPNLPVPQVESKAPPEPVPAPTPKPAPALKPKPAPAPKPAPKPITQLAPSPQAPVAVPAPAPKPQPVAEPAPPPPAPAPVATPETPPEPSLAPDLAGALSLTMIKGLGPKVAAMMAERGITRVDQVAALTDSEASELDIQLGVFTGRMARDRWIDQAKLLASGDTAAYEAEFGKLG